MKFYETKLMGLALGAVLTSACFVNEQIDEDVCEETFVEARRECYSNARGSKLKCYQEFKPVSHDFSTCEIAFDKEGCITDAFNLSAEINFEKGVDYLACLNEADGLEKACLEKVKMDSYECLEVRK